MPQQIARLDHLAFGEMALLDEARNSSGDVGLIDRRDAADEIADLLDLTAGHGLSPPNGDARTFESTRTRRQKAALVDGNHSVHTSDRSSQRAAHT